MMEKTDKENIETFEKQGESIKIQNTTYLRLLKMDKTLIQID